MPSRRKRKSTQPVKKVPYGVIDLTEDSSGDTCVVACKQSRSLLQNNELEKLLDQAAFYVHMIHKPTQVFNSTKGGHKQIGEFTLCLNKEDRLPEVTECWLYVATRLDGQHFIYQEQHTELEAPRLYHLVEFSSESVAPLLSALAVGMSNVGNRGSIRLYFNVGELGQRLNVQVIVDEKCIYDLGSYPSFIKLHSKSVHCTRAALTLAEYIQSTAPSHVEISEPLLPVMPSFHHNVLELFNAIKYKPYLDEEITPQLNVDTELDGPERSTPEGSSRRLLLSKLRPYQLEAVKWMIAKEKGLYTAAYANDVSKLFTPLPGDIYMNSDSGVICSRLPHLALQPGGILADEMGLGKTVEVLTCVVCHLRADVPEPSLLPSNAYVVEHLALAQQVMSAVRAPAQTVTTSVSVTAQTDFPSIITSVNKVTHDVKISAEALTISQTTHTETVGNIGNGLGKVADLSQDNQNTDVLKHVEMETDCSRIICTAAFVADKTNKPTQGSSERQGSTITNAMSNEDLKEVPQLTTGTEELTTGTEELTTGTEELTTGTEELTTGTEELTTGTEELTTETEELTTGTEELTTGTEELTTEAEELTTEAEQLTTGRKKSERSIESSSMGRAKTQAKFECTCGAKSSDKVIVACSQCSLQQHAKCVGYDVEDPYRGVYKCPHCHVISEPIKSGATLIIAPSAIKHQWREEIGKHVRSSGLKILEYEGVSSRSYIQPMTLARQDIVITTYDVLKSELRATNVPHSNIHMGRQLRKPKKFMALPSPLTAVEWWRVCLDEAQMVESVTTSTSEMALKLSAVNRWCVTGTPINSGVNDLFGLLVFLGVTPFCFNKVWETLIYRPYCFGLPNNLYTILRHIMWRTCKSDVREQLGLPPQTDIIHDVMLSSVEEVFYRQQYSVCRARCLKILDKYRNRDGRLESTRLDSLSHYMLAEVLNSLLSMRQACCYPEVSRGKGRQANAPKMILTMDELLKHLTQKVKVQSEESYRCIVAALNGQAACHIMSGQYEEAVEKYWEVLHPTPTEYQRVETDSLPLIHANHNLRELISSMPADTTKSIDVGQLEREAETLANHYMKKKTTVVVAAQVEHEVNNRKVYVSPLMSEKLLDGGKVNVWWMRLHDNDLQNLLSGTDTAVDILHHVHNGVYSSLNSQRITNEWIQLVMAHTEARDAVVQLNELGVQEDVVAAVAGCCLRPESQAITSKCLYCKADDLLKKDEYSLYDYSSHISLVGEEEQRTGNWADSVMELAFKAIISYLRHCITRHTNQYSAAAQLLNEYIKEATDHMTLLESVKVHFRKLRALWLLQRERVAAVDEMSMAKSRFRLGIEGETVESSSLVLTEKYQVDDLNHKQLEDLESGKMDFAAALRQHNYLEHIGSLPMDDKLGNTELCPICQLSLGHSWAVLSCCHSFCVNCIQVLSAKGIKPEVHVTLGLRHVIRCPVCRKETRRQQISYVSSGRAVSLSDEGISVKGNYSSKVMEVVRCLKVIERDEPEAKAVVFSTWTILLEVVAKALTENNITFQFLGGNKKQFEEKLKSFRHSAGIEALLLPIASGANGLNLTQATHVLLLEPLLHAGKEAQAIGRIHRIGQTKPTFVHRFIVRHTLEQHIHSVMSTLPSSADSLIQEIPFTLADLAAMFDSPV